MPPFDMDPALSPSSKESKVVTAASNLANMKASQRLHTRHPAREASVAVLVDQLGPQPSEGQDEND